MVQSRLDSLVLYKICGGLFFIMNYYELLGIETNASYDDVRKSYLALAKNYHPDLNRAHNANYLFNEIKNAYETLSNPVLREEYNLKMGIKRYDTHNSNEEYKYSNDENENINTQNENESGMSEKKKPFVLPVVVIIIAFIILYLGTGGGNSKEAINLVKEYYSASFGPEEWVVNESAHTIYGWTSQKVSGTTYYVAYEFDDDGNRSNGWSMYCYEVELSSDVVRMISGDAVLEKKYKDLGLID